jgi:exopolysaccharide biosynthesis polyprenyl glycosylphosphotransferase
MTPQVAQRLTIYDEPETADAGSGDRRPLAAGGGRVGLPARRLRHIDGGHRPLPSLVRRESLHRRLLGAADVLAATVALFLVITLLGSDHVGLATLALMPLVVVVFKIAGLYDRDPLRIVQSTLEEAPQLLQLTGLYALVVTILQPMLVHGTLGRDQLAALWVMTFIAILGGRFLARRLACHVLPPERCLVIGEARRSARIREKLASSHAHASVVATLPLEGDHSDSLHDPDTVRHIIGELNVDRIVIAPTTTDACDVVELIRVAKTVGVQVSVLPRMLEVVGSAVEFEDIDGMTMLGVRPFGLSRSSRSLKRAFDLVVTSLGLIVVGPVIAAIAAAIKLDSRGPVFYRQVRVGRDGRHFHIVKFRSMVADADARKDDLRGLNEVGDGMFKISNDPRVTRVGALLRRTSLDELPQLFNVLRGEMSLVGPRPLVTDEDALVLGLDRSRLHLTPGMTGPWQVLGARVPMAEMVGIDYLYVATWSLWQDVELLVRTARHVLRRGNV